MFNRNNILETSIEDKNVSSGSVTGVTLTASERLILQKISELRGEVMETLTAVQNRKAAKNKEPKVHRPRYREEVRHQSVSSTVKQVFREADGPLTAHEVIQRAYAIDPTPAAGTLIFFMTRFTKEGMVRRLEGGKYIRTEKLTPKTA